MLSEQLDTYQENARSLPNRRIEWLAGRIVLTAGMFFPGIIADSPPTADAVTSHSAHEAAINPQCGTAYGETVCVYGTQSGLTFEWSNESSSVNAEIMDFTDLTTGQSFLHSAIWEGPNKTYVWPLKGGEYKGYATLDTPVPNQHTEFEFDLVAGSQGVTPPKPGSCPDGETSPPGGTPKAMIVETNNQGCDGYEVVTSTGNVITFGIAKSYGKLKEKRPSNSVVDGVATPDGKGYWLVEKDGGVYTFGDARFFGSAANKKLGSSVVGMTATPDGKGYWLVEKDGGVYTFGDARFFGSAANKKLGSSVVGMTSTADGFGYWLVAQNGRIDNFGDADFYGPTSEDQIATPIVGMAANPVLGGYREVSASGNVYGFWGDSTKLGDLRGQKLSSPIVSIEETKGGNGYYLLDENGKIYAYGNARNLGSVAPSVG
jgi:hypothetical protein